MINKSIIFIVGVSFLLAGCGGTRKMITQKDQMITERGQEIAQMQKDNEQLITEKNSEIVRLQKSIDQLKSESSGQLKQKDRLADDLRKQIAGLKQKEQVLIQEKDNMTIITLPNAILFTSGSIKLTSEGQQIIDEIWTVLMKYPDRDIMLQGHTDNVPIAQKFQGKYKSNWELSSSRAHSVLHYVISKEGAHPERLAAVGYGEFKPVADNATEEGKAKNRRVVITVSGVTK
ncbi:MAG: OmpA family protein [Elusimicrobiota bacterium]